MLEFNKTNFATLEDAQSYVYAEETHKITSGKAGAWFGAQKTMYGVAEGGKSKQLLALIDEILENKLHPLYSLMKLIDSTLSKNSFFGIDPSKPLGVSNLYSLNVLITAGILSQQQADQFLTLSISTSNPYENKTQADWDSLGSKEFELQSNTDEHIINFAINESLENQSQVKVMCRYGSGDDLTPWHELTSRAVRFKQDTYSVFIPQCQHDTRELKLVSPVGLTVL